jgi:hypothetical protein
VAHRGKPRLVAARQSLLVSACRCGARFDNRPQRQPAAEDQRRSREQPDPNAAPSDGFPRTHVDGGSHGGRRRAISRMLSSAWRRSLAFLRRHSRRQSRTAPAAVSPRRRAS